METLKIIDLVSKIQKGEVSSNKVICPSCNKEGLLIQLDRYTKFNKEELHLKCNSCGFDYFLSFPWDDKENKWLNSDVKPIIH